MEVDDIQNQTQTQTPQQPCKYSRVNSNGRIDSSKIALGGGGGASNGGTHNNEVVGPTTTALATTTATCAMTGGGGGGGGVGGGLLGGEMVVGSNGTNSRFGRQWQHSSRIIRVSRASGGKDRHSKVWTAKGPRDRRVRLSVTTAIQFYDLQDRLGYDQPSKAVEWLIKAASEAINELPSLNTASFPPETPRQLSDERKSGGVLNNGVVDDSGVLELLADGEVNLGQNHQQQMGSRSGCSSNNSETSKGSGLSLSRSEIRVKARERARERTAKEKERDGEPSSSMVNVKHNNQQQHHQQNMNSMAQTSSFTQLLTAGMSNLNENNNGGGASSSPSAEMGLFHKHSRASGGGGNNNNNTANDNQWLSSATSTTQMADYFGNGLMGLSGSSRAGHIGLGSNTSSLPQVMTIASFGRGSVHHQSHNDQLQHHNPHHHHTHHHSQQPHFPFISDQHLIQVANAASGANGGGGGGGGNEYNLNFSMSSTSTTSSALAAAGYNNRGTLQSNSPSLLPYLQRFSAATDGSSLPFFHGSAAVSSASPNVENHHHQQHHHQQQHYQPPGLQLCYGDGGRQTDQKGKGKN